MNIYLSQSNMTEEIRFYTKLYANPEFHNLGWLSFIKLSSFNIWNKNNGNYKESNIKPSLWILRAWNSKSFQSMKVKLCIPASIRLKQSCKKKKSAGNFFSDLINFMQIDPIARFRQSLKRIAVPPRCLFINLSSPKQMSVQLAVLTRPLQTVCEDIMDLFSVSEAQGIPKVYNNSTDKLLLYFKYNCLFLTR